MRAGQLVPLGGAVFYIALRIYCWQRRCVGDGCRCSWQRRLMRISKNFSGGADHESIIHVLWANLGMHRVGVVGGVRYRACSTAGRGAQIEDAENQTKVTDKHCDEALAGQNKGEAREWLQDAKHVFFKSDRKKIAQFIEDFYLAGATQVYIVDTEQHDAIVYGGALLVVLPKDAAARAKIFTMDQGVAQAFDEDAVKDEGQKYLYHAFD